MRVLGVALVGLNSRVHERLFQSRVVAGARLARGVLGKAGGCARAMTGGRWVPECRQARSGSYGGRWVRHPGMYRLLP